MLEIVEGTSDGSARQAFILCAHSGKWFIIKNSIDDAFGDVDEELAKNEI